jgi:hypothetical protein
METFYVTLPSNVRNNLYDNKIGNYRTILPCALQLDNNWKVGLASIHYTNSWFNVKTYNEVVYTRHDKETDLFSNTAYVAPGRYSDINTLLEAIMSKVKPYDNVERKPVLSFNPYSRRVTIVYGISKQSDFITFKFGDELKELLGLSDGYLSQEAMFLNASPYYGDENKIKKVLKDTVNQSLFTVEKDTLESLHNYDINGGIHNLMVYSDVVDFSVVGDVKAQLLRVVEIPPSSAFGESIVLTYEKPYFLPLATKEISSIEIDIKDDSGHQVDFQFGRVEVTLQFVRNG